MNFFNPKTGIVSTETVLQMSGFPTDNLEVMRTSNWFPITYKYVICDPLLEEQEVDGDLVFDEKNKVYIQNFKKKPLSESELKNNLTRLQNEAVKKINEDTSGEILKGFDFEVKGETLHFSYDAFDQGNFTATVVTTISNELTNPTPITWNGYRGWTPENKGELVVLKLSSTEFQQLYDASQDHKNEKMTEGANKKNLVNSADSIQALREVFNQLTINEEELSQYAN